MAEWWVNNVGQNLLKGVFDDPQNPIRLSDMMIASFFDKIPEAADSYRRMRGGLLEEERARLDPLLAMADSLEMDESHARTDRIQANWNKAGIRTMGRFGGTRRGGNV